MHTVEPSPIVRRFADCDADAVRALFIEVNRELAPPALRLAFEDYIGVSLREEMGRIPEYYGTGSGRGFWIAECAGRLAGFFGLEPAGDDAAELRRVYVAPLARRRGLGSAMLAEAERQCAAAGLRRLVLSTSELQGAAIAMYVRSGFRLVDESPASAMTNKTVGGGIRRFYFEKDIGMDQAAAG